MLSGYGVAVTARTVVPLALLRILHFAIHGLKSMATITVVPLALVRVGIGIDFEFSYKRPMSQ